MSLPSIQMFDPPAPGAPLSALGASADVRPESDDADEASDFGSVLDAAVLLPPPVEVRPAAPPPESAPTLAAGDNAYAVPPPPHTAPGADAALAADGLAARPAHGATEGRPFLPEPTEPPARRGGDFPLHAVGGGARKAAEMTEAPSHRTARVGTPAEAETPARRVSVNDTPFSDAPPTRGVPAANPEAGAEGLPRAEASLPIGGMRHERSTLTTPEVPGEGAPPLHVGATHASSRAAGAADARRLSVGDLIRKVSSEEVSGTDATHQPPAVGSAPKVEGALEERAGTLPPGEISARLGAASEAPGPLAEPPGLSVAARTPAQARPGDGPDAFVAHAAEVRAQAPPAAPRGTAAVALLASDARNFSDATPAESQSLGAAGRAPRAPFRLAGLIRTAQTADPAAEHVEAAQPRQTPPAGSTPEELTAGLSEPQDVQTPEPARGLRAAAAAFNQTGSASAQEAPHLAPLPTRPQGPQAQSGPPDARESARGEDAAAGAPQTAAAAAEAPKGPAAQPAAGRPETLAAQVALPVIAEAAALRPREPRTLRVSLRPDELGRVEVELSRDGEGRLTARLTAETDAAHRLLSGGLEQLRQTLESSGLQVERLDVSVGANAQQQQAAQQQGGGGRGGETFADGRHPLPEETRTFATPGGANDDAERLVSLRA